MPNDPTPDASAPTTAPVAENAPLPAEQPAPPPSAEAAPAPETTPAVEGGKPDELGVARAASPMTDSVWLKRQEVVTSLIEQAGEVLKLALSGHLPDDQRSKVRVDAAIAILCRGY